MRILVVVKQVPDSRSTLSILPDGSGLDTAGLRFVCNPFDEFAVEQAVQLRETRTDIDEIVAVTIGPAETLQTLRTALAMGADRGIQILADDSVLFDELYLAQTIAAAVRREEQGYDLILCGKQGIDNDAGDLGPALAESLGLPHIGSIVELTLNENGNHAKTKRQIEGSLEVVETPLPALLTCEKGLVEPRYPSLPNIMKAKKKPVEKVEAEALPGMAGRVPAATFVTLAPPPARKACTFLEGTPEEMARKLIRALREEAKVI